MATFSKVTSACLRVAELMSACIILGILARFFYVLDRVNGPADPRVTYAISMAALSVVFSFVLLPPLAYSFWCFPLDFALSVCWITCFALLTDVSGSNTCSSAWYDRYWAYYWNELGDSPKGTVDITDLGCSKWKVVLAFSFFISFCWFLNAFIGLYVCSEHYNLGPNTRAIIRKFKWWKKSDSAATRDVESQEHKPQGAQAQRQM
ncbi:hypothetical protein RB595_002134 [Gaeumannomyces hyphopodioides]